MNFEHNLNPLTMNLRIEMDDSVQRKRHILLSSTYTAEFTWLTDLKYTFMDIFISFEGNTSAPIQIKHEFNRIKSTHVLDFNDLLDFQVEIVDKIELDINGLNGPLGDLLKYFIFHRINTGINKTAELIAELCKENQIFCTSEFNIWCFVGYLFHYGQECGHYLHGMQCLRSLGIAAKNPQLNIPIFINHIIYFIELLNIYGLSATENNSKTSHHCFKSKDSITFLMGLGDMIATHFSVSLVKNILEILLIQYRGVLYFLCGQHHGYDQVCASYMRFQWQVIRSLPSHTILWSQATFIAMNTAQYTQCHHVSDDSIEYAAKIILHVVSNSQACQEFVANNGLLWMGRIGQLILNGYTQKNKKSIFIVRQLIISCTFLLENILRQEILSKEIETLFFPFHLTKEIMPFMEILLLPLMPLDETQTWTECTILAAKVISEIFETRSSRVILENHLFHIAFRFKQPRIQQIKMAIEICLECTSWDHEHAIQVIQKVYFIAIRKGIKLGILSAECTELLPQSTKNENAFSRRSIKNGQSSSHLNTKPADNPRHPHDFATPFRQQLLACVNFADQHRDGRLKDILVRNRKKGIGEMLAAVDNSARMLVLVHNILEMFLETYVIMMSEHKIEYAIGKLRKLRKFCKDLETIGALVVSALNQMDGSYFNQIFAQLNDIKIPSTDSDNQMEWRSVIRGNMKKLLFFLKRIIDKKKLKPLLDEQSFLEAEEILVAIRLDFAVNGRRRLGHVCLDNASIADFLCEAAELGGLERFSQFITSAKYIVSRSMLRADNTLYKLEDFMLGITPAMGLREIIHSIFKPIIKKLFLLITAPYNLFQFISTIFQNKNEIKSKQDELIKNIKRKSTGQTLKKIDISIDMIEIDEKKRKLNSHFPIPSVMYCLKHEKAFAFNRTWKNLRELGVIHTPSTNNSVFSNLLKSNFIEDFCDGILPLKQQKLIELLINGKGDEYFEGLFTLNEREIILRNMENYLARQDIDGKMYHVDRTCQKINVWQFLITPVYHTKLLHLYYLLQEMEKISTFDDCQRLWYSMERGHTSLTNVIRLNPMMKLKATKKIINHQYSKRSFNFLNFFGKKKNKNSNQDLWGNVDDIQKKPLGTIFSYYVLPVCDQQLDDPLSEKMAWDHLIDEINRNSFPSWVFWVEDSNCSPTIRKLTKLFRGILRIIIRLTFWRSEEFYFDMQDTSWPRREVIHLTNTKRKVLETDIIESIIIYKHFMKAMSELFRVWMLESGSLGLPLWQHWGFFIGGCIFPAFMLNIYLPSVYSYSNNDVFIIDHHMKWFLASFFLIIFTFVLWSIARLVKRAENLRVQERQEVRIYPVTRHYSNYLAIFGLFSELIQHNSIPFNNNVKWTPEYKLPKLIHYFGRLGITNFDLIHTNFISMAYFKCILAAGILFMFLIVLKCANKFHKTYPKLNTRITKDLPPIISGLLYVGIVNSFSSLLFCCTCEQFSGDEINACLIKRKGSNEPFLYNYPEVELICWSHDHIPLAYTGLIGLTFFIPIGILGAGMSQVLFPLESLDIKFSPILALSSQLAKTITAITRLNLILFILTIVCKTCSIWYIGTIKSVIYLMSTWTCICALINMQLETSSSGPVYYLNLGWFIIISLASIVLGIRLRIRNIREERARTERLRDYQILNDKSETNRLTDMEEDIIRRASKPLTSDQLEATAPKGFIAASKILAEQLEKQNLPPHLEEFMRLSRQSIEKPTTSEFMFVRRARRLGKRISAFENSERYLKVTERRAGHYKFE